MVTNDGFPIVGTVNSGNESDISVFQWHTRNIINRFLVAQTEAEQTLARNMDLVIGRTKEPRVIVVTVAGDCTDNTINTNKHQPGPRGPSDPYGRRREHSRWIHLHGKT